MGRLPSKKTKRQGEGNDVIVEKPKANDSSLTCSSNHYVVGTWARSAQHNQAIVIKIFFKKSIMAWEIIMGEDNVKRKIQTPFSNILALKVINNDFHIMLNVAPRFFKDTNVDAKQHSKWADCGDFTHSQASFERLHTFTCYSKQLKKFCKKIFATTSVLPSLFILPFPFEEDPSQIPSGYPLDHPSSSQAPPGYPLDHLNAPQAPPGYLLDHPSSSQAPPGYPLDHLNAPQAPPGYLLDHPSSSQAPPGYPLDHLNAPQAPPGYLLDHPSSSQGPSEYPINAPHAPSRYPLDHPSSSQGPSEYPLNYPSSSQAPPGYPLDYPSSSQAPHAPPGYLLDHPNPSQTPSDYPLERDSFQTNEDLDREIFKAMWQLKRDSCQDDRDLIRDIFKANMETLASLQNNFDSK